VQGVAHGTISQGASARVSVERHEIVRRAFEVFRADVESPPPLTLRGGDRVDSYDFPEPYDAGLDEPTDEYIERFAFHAMPFLDATSWRHYLPRFMDHVFRRPDEPTGLVIQAVIRSLRAPDREPPRLATLNADQEAVVVAFLESIAADSRHEDNAEDAQQALLEWWVPNARHRPTQAAIEERRRAPVSWHEVGSANYRLTVPTTFAGGGVRAVPAESRRVEMWDGYLRGDIKARVLVHFEPARDRTLGDFARGIAAQLVVSDGEATPVKLAGAKRACRLGGFVYGYSHSPEELERGEWLLAIVGDELLTVRATAWRVREIETELGRIVESFRLT
jgi:hypothetical protein